MLVFAKRHLMPFLILLLISALMLILTGEAKAQKFGRLFGGSSKLSYFGRNKSAGSWFSSASKGLFRSRPSNLLKMGTRRPGMASWFGSSVWSRRKPPLVGTLSKQRLGRPQSLKANQKPALLAVPPTVKHWTDSRGLKRVTSHAVLRDGSQIKVSTTPTYSGKGVRRETTWLKDGAPTKKMNVTALRPGVYRKAVTYINPADGTRRFTDVVVTDKSGNPRQTYKIFYRADGTPDFHRYALQKVTIPVTGNRRLDGIMADAKAGIKVRPNRTDWHHDGHGKMLLLPEDLHGAIGHRGEVSQLKRGK
jgi:hypothetical protein